MVRANRFARIALRIARATTFSENHFSFLISARHIPFRKVGFKETLTNAESHVQWLQGVIKVL